MNENAVLTDALKVRIKQNSNQSYDYDKWVLDKLNLSGSESVLELCCGTGSQTIAFSSKLTKGHLVAVDISRESISYLSSRVGSNTKLICSDIDNIGNYVGDNEKYDILFCSYGLYYSKNYKKLIQSLIPYIGKKIVIVGPTLDNNKQLFEILLKSNISIPEKVLHCCNAFMFDLERLFLSLFETVNSYRIINRVLWETADQFIQYWKNSTFYAKEKEEVVLEKLNHHFSFNEKFINQKSICYLETYI